MSAPSPPSTPSPVAPTEAARGALAAASCYLLWGLVPLYWKRLADISPVELIAHRQIWSLMFVIGLVVMQGGSREVRTTLSSLPGLRRNLLSASLLTCNWLVYVWGVNTGHVIETSLGYFLVPLVSAAAGRFVLGEHLRPLQWTALAAAAIGVALMILRLGRPPWIALALAGSWGWYGLLRKQSPLGAVTGLTVETLLLAPLALGILAWQHHTGEGALGRVDAVQHLLVFGTGLITAVPLLLFAYGARRLRLTTLGVLQYIAPTVQFGLGYWVYHEPFSPGRALGFACCWAGLALYTVDNLAAHRRTIPLRRDG